MTLREKILKTFIVTIREINTHGGAEKFFEKYPVGGMYFGEADVLRDENGVEIGTQLDFDKLNECKKYSKNKLLVCADGCEIQGQKVHIGTQRSLGGSVNLEDAYEYGKIIGMQCNDKGVDWVLGPSIDMCFDPLMYLMAISDDPEITAKIYREVVKGIQDQGVCATVKHFPGLGTYYVNMHIGPGSNVLSMEEWMKTYGYVYKEMFNQGVQSVMTTHVTLKAYDNERHDGFYPTATFSKKLTTDLLKNELGFEGAVVTDALIMGGMATGDLVAETVQAFKAGADLLLWPPVEAAEKIEEAILSGEIPMSRLDDALARIEKMESFRNKALEEKTYDKPDAAYADAKTIEIAKHGICQLRNEIGLLPLSEEKYKKILIVDTTEKDIFGDRTSSNLLKEALEKRGIKADVRRDIYDEPSWVVWQDDVDKISAEYDLVIFNLNAQYASEWSEPHIHIWASHLFKKDKKLFINYSSPYWASEYLPEDPTIIEVNTKANEEIADYIVKGLFGEVEFTGQSLLTKVKDWEF